MFSRHTIRSRGTVCWSAEHEGQRYIIKDYWRAEGRACESMLLKKLACIKGVGQMFAFQDDRESIKAGRGFKDAEVMDPDNSKAQPVLNRWHTRIVMPRYGETLEKAKSARQLLCAVRDAFQGEYYLSVVSVRGNTTYNMPISHRDSLLQQDILHRDISFANLLLSSYEESGVLIDWDLAKEISELFKNANTEGDSRTVRISFYDCPAHFSFGLL
jgi:hypothetical protein